MNQFDDDEDERRRREEDEAASGGISTKPPGEGGSGGQLEAGGGGSLAQHTAEESDWLSRNPGDEHRMSEALGNYTGDRLYDSQGPEINNGNGSRSGGSSGSGGLASAYGGYLGQPTQAPQLDLSPLTAQIQQMQQQQQMERERQQMERASLRELIMGRMSEASKPVDMNAPGIREILSAQRLSGQRGEERQRSQLAARLSSEGLLDSGTFDTGVGQLAQQRGESEQQGIADVFGKETDAKRQEIMQLLQMAMSSGDAESARNLQEELATMDAGIQTQQMSDVNSRFGQDLGFRKSSFVDNLGLQLMLAQMGANSNATGAFF